MARGSGSRSSGGGRSSSSSRPPSYFGGGSSRSTHSSASASTAPTRTATRSPSTAPPPAVQTSQPPANHPSTSQPSTYQQQSSAPSGGGGLLSGLAGTVMQGMAFGGGSAIAHRAVDSIAGPRTVIHEHQGGEVEQQAARTTLAAIETGDDRVNQQVEQQCGDEVMQFQKCLRETNNQLRQCSFYLDSLTLCQKGVQENQQWH